MQALWQSCHEDGWWLLSPGRNSLWRTCHGLWVGVTQTAHVKKCTYETSLSEFVSKVSCHPPHISSGIRLCVSTTQRDGGSDGVEGGVVARDELTWRDGI